MVRRDTMLLFDLEPDEAGPDAAAVTGSVTGTGPGAGPEDGSGAGPGGARGGRVPALADPVRAAARSARALLARQPRRRLVALGTAVAVVVGGTAGVTVAVRHARADAAERARVAAVVASPGGVRDLGHGGLTAAWTTPLTGEVLGALPGTVVTADGGDVVGLRLADGREAWRHALGGQVDCGPAAVAGERAATPTTLTCLAGPAADRRVTVIDARGDVVGQRDLGDATGHDLHPLAGGGLLDVQRTGEVPPPAPILDESDLTAFYPDGLLVGQGVRLTVTDAVTGDARWVADIPFRPVADVRTCGLAPDQDAGFRVHTEATVRVSATVVDVEGCGVAADYLPDGAPLTAPPGSVQDALVPDPSGGFARVGDTSAFLDARGAVRFTVPSVAALPVATDGPAPQRLVLDGSGHLVALGADGARVWPAGGRSGTGPRVTTVLARAGGVVLSLGADNRTLVAQRADDGAATWNVRLPGGLTAVGQPEVVTDGRVAVLAVGTGMGQGAVTHVVGVDLRTGETWTAAPPATGDPLRLLAVDGRLLAYTATDTVVAGTLPGGETAWAREGTLTLLAPRAPR
ncbi:PQQ-binding-like beta-propeller repeat protein [Xylanimonas protaetiae]|uniref:Pyrrolo-quinoline quinone repeat domain-containing protein n=1 Tax=Xylanimonas protaetiae TaxID=2509457 RepID=A0A4P6F432_9MICO|nr:PQQ-binding-like beta-propeller repeat protein [Xylanimonas protaetiae]QAY69433.1 hypothetical protein ET471_04755 [Xylanimonas protaetiae]